MKLAEKHDTGQEGIKIVKFEKRNSYYLYIYDPETRKVSTPSLNSEDLDWCKRNWFQTYASFQKKGGSPKQRKKVAITTKLKAYVLGALHSKYLRAEMAATTVQKQQHPYLP